jgi:hypothetical protein
MLIVTWSAAAPDFDVDTFLSEFAFSPDKIWRSGETTSYGRQIQTSGFSAVFEGEDSFEIVFSQLREFLTEAKPLALALRQRGLSSTLDFGFTVGGGKHFTRSLRFPSDFLSVLVELGISLHVSAYPSSNETP